MILPSPSVMVTRCKAEEQHGQDTLVPLINI